MESCTYETEPSIWADKLERIGLGRLTIARGNRLVGMVNECICECFLYMGFLAVFATLYKKALIPPRVPGSEQM